MGRGRKRQGEGQWAGAGSGREGDSGQGQEAGGRGFLALDFKQHILVKPLLRRVDTSHSALSKNLPPLYT